MRPLKGLHSSNFIKPVSGTVAVKTKFPLIGENLAKRFRPQTASLMPPKPGLLYPHRTTRKNGPSNSAAFLVPSVQTLVLFIFAASVIPFFLNRPLKLSCAFIYFSLLENVLDASLPGSQSL